MIVSRLKRKILDVESPNVHWCFSVLHVWSCLKQFKMTSWFKRAILDLDVNLILLCFTPILMFLKQFKHDLNGIWIEFFMVNTGNLWKSFPKSSLNGRNASLKSNMQCPNENGQKLGRPFLVWGHNVHTGHCDYTMWGWLYTSCTSFCVAFMKLWITKTSNHITVSIQDKMQT